MNNWVYDGIQVLNAITKYRYVDSNRIAFAGISHGGQIALYAGAIERGRISSVISMSAFLSYEDIYTKAHNWTGHAIPGIGALCDMGDIAALIAPRPLLVQWGENDRRGRWAQLQLSSLAEFDRTKWVYGQLNATHNLHKEITPNAGHEFNVRAVVNFLDRFL